MKSRRTNSNLLVRNQRPLLILGAAVIVATFVVLLALRKNWNSEKVVESVPQAEVAAPPLSPLTASPYLESMRQAKYVGSNVCVECHRDQHASYLETAHSRSFGLVDLAAEPPDGKFARDDAPWRYESNRHDGELHHREFLASSTGEVTLVELPLAYRVGSGRVASTYLAEVDGIFVESPLTWYATEQAWQLSPGFHRRTSGSFARNVGGECLFCHVGRVETQPQSPFRFAIEEHAIGCERCHGPGSLHAERRRSEPALPNEIDLTIVNPRDLNRELSESICQQCHLEAVASAEVRGRRREGFRAGLRWSDFVANYAYEDGQEGMTVTGHVQQLHISRCYQASESLTCLTCHDPHNRPASDERLQHFRAACLQCHADNACRLPPGERASRNDNDCAACHMPQSPTNVPHVAFTHHRIGIHQPIAAAADGLPPLELTPVLDLSHLPEVDQQRTLGLAWPQILPRHQRDARFPATCAKVESLLQQVASQGVRDPAVLSALAQMAMAWDDLAAARQHAETALADESATSSDRIACHHLLAILDFRDGRPDLARPRLELLIQWRLEPFDWFRLATCREVAGEVDGAINAYEKVIAIDPTYLAAYRSLAELYRLQGDQQRARELESKAMLLESLSVDGNAARDLTSDRDHSE